MKLTFSDVEAQAMTLAKSGKLADALSVVTTATDTFTARRNAAVRAANQAVAAQAARDLTALRHLRNALISDPTISAAQSEAPMSHADAPTTLLALLNASSAEEAVYVVQGLIAALEQSHQGWTTLHTALGLAPGATIPVIVDTVLATIADLGTTLTLSPGPDGS